MTESNDVLDLSGFEVSTNKPMVHLKTLLNKLTVFQNRFEQFKEVTQHDDQMFELLKTPHVAMLWENLCVLSKEAAQIGNDTSWKN